MPAILTADYYTLALVYADGKIAFDDRVWHNDAELPADEGIPAMRREWKRLQAKAKSQGHKIKIVALEGKMLRRWALETVGVDIAGVAHFTIGVVVNPDRQPLPLGNCYFDAHQPLELEALRQELESRRATAKGGPDSIVARPHGNL
jgi:hypothetical protein